MNFFGMMDIAASGLAAQRLRMETVASNLANATTTRTPEGGPYRRRDVVFEAAPAGPGRTFADALDASLRQVRVTGVTQDSAPPRLRYEPGHPDADAQGFVAYPNVDTVVEMVNLVGASRAYEANLTVIDATKSLMLRAMEI